jgi:hypothetical protein
MCKQKPDVYVKLNQPSAATGNLILYTASLVKYSGVNHDTVSHWCQVLATTTEQKCRTVGLQFALITCHQGRWSLNHS